jgi:fatty-acyl-CoA synthase
MESHAHRLDELLDAFRSRPSGAAAFIEEDGTPHTIEDFDRLVARTANWLTFNGIAPGDRIAVWLVNRIEWLALLFAAARTGVIIAAVNTRYRTAELEHVLLSSAAKMLILQPDFGRIDFMPALRGLDPARLPELENVAIVQASQSMPATLLDRPTVAFDLDAVEDEGSGPHPDTLSDPEAPLILFTTSGTTSSPKLVIHPQRTLAVHAFACARAFGFSEAGASFITAMPFCGVFGLNSVLAAIAGASPVHIVPVFETEDALQRIHSHRITHLFGSDEMFRRLAEADFDKLGHARLCCFASFTPGLGEFLRGAAERGLPLSGLYGSSEVNALFSFQALGLPIPERLKGGGRPASRAAAAVRVRDTESGELLGPNQTGALEIRAPTNFIGYFRNPEATRKAIDDEGYFHTGDIGYLRRDGSFVYLARSGDAIRLSGFLVDPVEIEEVLKGIAGVRDAQVVGIELAGQTRPVAFIIPDDGAFDEETVIAAARQVLAHFKVPIRAFPLDRFPTTDSANGLKIQKAKLRQMASERLREEAGRP